MPSAPSAHAHNHAVCVTLERRRSDFERDARVTPFTGSCCCCCCCLHWIGAAIGGVVGMRMGWTSGEKKLAAPLPNNARQALRWGIIIGVVFSAMLIIVALVLQDGPLEEIAESYLLAVALVPSLAVIPVGISMLAGAYGARSKMLSAFRREAMKLPSKDGSDTSMSIYRAKLTAPPKTRDPVLEFSIFCRHCWFDLGESMHLPTCPECQEPTNQAVISGPDYGVGIAWRAGLMSFAISTGASVIGYLLILLIALVAK